MKIAVISHSAVVPLYRQKFHLMAEQGHDIHLILPPQWPEGNRWIKAPPAGQEKGINLHPLPAWLLGHVGGFFFLKLRYQLKKIMPDLVHVEEEPFGLVCWQYMRINQELRRPWLVYSWANMIRRYHWPLSEVDQQVLKHCNYALVGNHEGTHVLQQRGYQGPIALIPQYGINPSVYKKKTDKQKSDGHVVKLIYAGRLNLEKGIQLLLAALATIKTECQLTIMGTGPYQKRLRKKIRQLGISKRVNFQAAVAHERMAEELNQYDGLILPSLTTNHWKEQFGRVLIEAMACELPVIGSSSGEIPHVIGDAGLVFAEGDVVALKEKIELLLTQPKKRVELGKLGRQRVLAHYTNEKIVERTLLVYRNMLANSKK